MPREITEGKSIGQGKIMGLTRKDQWLSDRKFMENQGSIMEHSRKNQWLSDRKFMENQGWQIKVLAISFVSYPGRSRINYARLRSIE